MSKRSGALAKKSAAAALAPKEDNKKAASPSSPTQPSSQPQAPASPKQSNDASNKGKKTESSNKKEKVKPSSGGSKTMSGGKGGLANEAIPLSERQARFIAWRDTLNGPARGEEGYSLWFSPNPYKRAIEKAWLEWTVVWTAVMAVVMATGMGSYWEDPGLILMGSILMMGTYFWPYHRASHMHFPTLNAMFYGNVALSFAMHYIATPFFFDVLHMRYGFNVELRIDRNPAFLYLLTVPYFATYQVLSCVCVRRATHFCNYGKFWKSEANDFLRLGVGIFRMYLVVSIPFLVALLETVTNANPLIADLFCYDNTVWALTFGSFAYGIGFVFSIPLWLYAVSDEPLTFSLEDMTTKKTNFELFLSKRSRFWHSVLGQVGGAVLHGVCLYYLRHEVAPHYTTVIEDSDPFGGCLADGPRPVAEWLQLLARMGGLAPATGMASS